MGMKANSNHFAGNNQAGGPSKRRLSLNLQFFAEMPKDRSQIMHIMRKSKGHLVDTPENRAIIVNMTEDHANYLGVNKFGNSVYSKTVGDVQYWAYVRDGIIQDAGANFENHRSFKETIVKKERKQK